MTHSPRDIYFSLHDAMRQTFESFIQGIPCTCCGNPSITSVELGVDQPTDYHHKNFYLPSWGSRNNPDIDRMHNTEIAFCRECMATLEADLRASIARMRRANPDAA
jgi:hypothetical protein